MLLAAAAAAADAGGVAIYWPAGSTGWAEGSGSAQRLEMASLAQPFERAHAQLAQWRLTLMPTCSDQHPQLSTRTHPGQRWRSPG